MPDTDFGALSAKNPYRLHHAKQHMDNRTTYQINGTTRGKAPGSASIVA